MRTISIFLLLGYCLVALVLGAGSAHADGSRCHKFSKRLQGAQEIISEYGLESPIDFVRIVRKFVVTDPAEWGAKIGLLSGNGASYISGDWAVWLDDKNMDHIRGAPYHPKTQGKIERWHQTLKNRILLENYFLPGDLKGNIKTFVEQYNHHRYHESLNNLTPADVYFGRGKTILLQRERIKQNTFEQRRLQYRKAAA